MDKGAERRHLDVAKARLTICSDSVGRCRPIFRQHCKNGSHMQLRTLGCDASLHAGVIVFAICVNAATNPGLALGFLLAVGPAGLGQVRGELLLLRNVVAK